MAACDAPLSGVAVFSDADTGNSSRELVSADLPEVPQGSLANWPLDLAVEDLSHSAARRYSVVAYAPGEGNGSTLRLYFSQEDLLSLGADDMLAVADSDQPKVMTRAAFDKAACSK